MNTEQLTITMGFIVLVFILLAFKVIALKKSIKTRKQEIDYLEKDLSKKYWELKHLDIKLTERVKNFEKCMEVEFVINPSSISHIVKDQA